MGRGLQFSSNYIHSDVSSIRGGFVDTSRGAAFRKTSTGAIVGLLSTPQGIIANTSTVWTHPYHPAFSYSGILRHRGVSNTLSATVQLRVCTMCQRDLTRSILLAICVWSVTLQPLM